MNQPVHYDLGLVERQTRESLLQGCEKMRAQNKRKGVPDTLTDLQEIMGAVLVSAVVATCDAVNRGHSDRLITVAFGMALGSAMRTLLCSMDDDPVLGEVCMNAFTSGLAGGAKGGDLEFSTRIQPTRGGNA